MKQLNFSASECPENFNLTQIVSTTEISRDHRIALLAKKRVQCAKDITHNHARGWFRVMVIKSSLAT